MLELLSNVEYNVPGDTYFVAGDDASYLVSAEPAGFGFELKLIEKTDSDWQEVADTTYCPENYDDAEELFRSFYSNLETLVFADRLSYPALLEAWEEL